MVYNWVMRKIISRNPLFFAWLLPALTDGVVTLVGQEKSYWLNHQLVNEASPAYYVLVASPWLFILGSIVWFGWWYWLFLRLKPPVNFWLMFLFISGHSWGSTLWIFKMLKPIGVSNAWFLAVGYFVLIAMCATHCLKVYLKTLERANK